MATLSELVDTIATTEGLDPASVALIGRYLREFGLITKRGRGLSAASMSVADAANLLIAVNATRNAAEAAKTAQTYRRLRPEEHEIPISELRRDFTLGEAVEQLLTAAGSGALPQPFLGINRDDAIDLSEMFAAGQVHVELRFRINAPSALLRVAQAFDQAPTELALTIPALVLLHFSWRRGRDPPGTRQHQNGDRVEEITIGFRTLRAVGKLIRSQA